MNLSQTKSDDMYNVSIVRKSMQSFIENATEFGSVIYSSQDDNETAMANDTLDFHFEPKEYIFDRKEVRIIFVTLYSLVFCCCFFGEWLFIRINCLRKFSGFWLTWRGLSFKLVLLLNVQNLLWLSKIRNSSNLSTLTNLELWRTFIIEVPLDNFRKS